MRDSVRPRGQQRLRRLPAVRGAGLTASGSITPRGIEPVAVRHADGTVLLGPLRQALSGAGPVLVPHPHDRPPHPAAIAPLTSEDDLAGDPLAVVVSTTGSTGTAKHVLLPASALLAAAAAAHDRLGGAGRWLLAVPAHTVAGVQVVVRSLVAGTQPEVCDLAGGFAPARFAAATDRLASGRNGRRYTSIVPTQLHRLLLDPRGAHALRAYDAVLVGGAALDDALRSRAESAGIAVVGTYGMTETCGGCVYDGVPLPGVGLHVELVPGTSADQPGRVVIHGPVVARGYRAGGPQAVAGGEGFDVVHDRPAFRTADRGTLDGGLLRLDGRFDDVVLSGGVNVSLDAVSRSVAALPGVAATLAVGLPDPRWGQVVGLLLEPTPGHRGPSDDDVRDAVRSQLGRAAVPRVLRRVASVPLTGVGKPDRRAAAELLGPDRTVGAGLSDHDDSTRTERPEEPTA